MVLEVAILNVKEGEELNFERKFKIAQKIVENSKGYISHDLLKCMEVKNQYILLIKWVTLEDHEIGFRKSEPYQEWKNLLHDFYDPFPVVNHYSSVIG